LRAVGLSIEGNRIRLSIIDRALWVIRPIKALEIELPTTEEQKTEVLKKLLTDIKTEHRVEGITIGLPFSEFGYHIISLPRTSQKDIENALRYELEKHLPLPIDEYMYDFEVIEKRQKTSKSLVLSIKKERLRWLIDAVTGSGLRLFGIRCSFFEALNEFISSKYIDGSIFIEHSEDDYWVAGIRKGYPEVVKFIKKDLLEKEIETLKETFRAGLYGIDIGKYPENLKITGLPLSIAHLIAVAPFRRRAVVFDFLEKEKKPQMDYLPFVAVLLISVSLALYIFTDIGAYYKEHSALKETDAQIEIMKQTAKGIIEESRALSKTAERIDFLFTFRKDSGIPIMALRELSTALPKDAWLTDFSSDSSGKIEIKGLAPRAADIIEPLEGSKVFKNIEFSAPVTRKDSLQRFSLKMEIER